MFIALGLILIYQLGSFGGVLRQNWLSVEMLWLVSVAIMFALRVLRRRSIDVELLAFILFCATVAFWAPAKLAVGLIATGWAYVAVSEGTTKIGKFLHFLLLIGLLEAGVGLMQYFVIPGWILGYQSPLGEVSGTLINRNHFAGLLEMFVPVAFGLAYVARGRFGGLARPYLYLLAGAFMALALFFSLSRMGILSFCATLVFLAAVLQLANSQRRLGVAMGFGIMGLVLLGVLWIGSDSIVERYAKLVGEEALLREGRLVIFQNALRMIAAHPAGVGTGNFQDQFRVYQTFRPDLLFDHAHNDYLETAAEWGLPLAALYWSILIFAVIRGVRMFAVIDSVEDRGILLASTGAIFSILLHSLADFNLQIPSNATVFFTFVGIALAVPARPLKNARIGTPSGRPITLKTEQVSFGKNL